MATTCAWLYCLSLLAHMLGYREVEAQSSFRRVPLWLHHSMFPQRAPPLTKQSSAKMIQDHRSDKTYLQPIFIFHVSEVLYLLKYHYQCGGKILSLYTASVPFMGDWKSCKARRTISQYCCRDNFQRSASLQTQNCINI